MPHELEQRVSAVRETWNRRALIELGCLLAASLFALLLTVGFIDYLLRIADRGTRILLTVALATGAAVIAWRLAQVWRARRWSDFTAAQSLQRAFPELGDRLASALEFLRQDEEDPVAGSARLRRAVVADTTAAVENLPLSDAAISHTLPKAVWALGVALALATLVSLLAPATVRTALARIAAPWNNVEWPRRNDLAFENTPKLVARGGMFEASLVDQAGELPAEVAIQYRYEYDGRRQSDESWMQRVGDHAVARRENVQQSFEYRAVGGDHQTMPWTPVEVVDPPSISDWIATLHPPAYSGLPTEGVTRIDTILSGTTIELAATANGPLKSAAVLTPGAEKASHAVTIAGAERNKLTLLAGQWTPTAETASTTERYQLQLTAENALVTTTPPATIRIRADTPPKVTWALPQSDSFVLAGAVVSVRAFAADDLAIASAELRVAQPTAQDAPLETQGDAEPDVQTISLFSGSDTPPARSELPDDRSSLDEESLSLLLDIANLNVAAGDVLELTITATDYRPQTGVSPATRRIHIVTLDELDSQLAANQAEILRLLEQALADQRQSQQQASQVAATGASAAVVDRMMLDALVTARLAQQNVTRTLTGDDESVMARVAHLISRIDINRLQRTALVAQLETIREEVGRLAVGPLPACGQQLTNVRKQLDARLGRATSADEFNTSQASFASLESSQQEVIDSLEALIEGAADWSDSDRFVRELARLETEQRELRQRTLAAARRQLAARANRNGEGVTQAELQQLAGAQADLARRYSKLAQAMQQMATQADRDTSDFAQRVADALASAEANNLAGTIDTGRRQLDSGQLGRAADSQQASAEDLKELVEILRDRRPTDDAALASKLRDLQQQLADLRNKASAAAQQADPTAKAKQRSDLAQELARMARELSRMTAPEAGQSTQQAGSSAAPKPGESPQSAKQDMQQAQEQIEKAEQQLAERIAELEQQQQKKLLDRLAEVLDQIIPGQQQVLESTLQLELVREQQDFGVAENQGALQLAQAERELSGDLNEAIADLDRRGVFQIALSGAADDMAQASESLGRQETGRITQQLELAALTRMRHVLDVLREPPPTPDENSDPQQGGGGAGGQQQPQQPPLIELAEVKMLRWLQNDLNGQTRLYEADLADNADRAADKRAAAARLASEQRKLEELVRDMMGRNNRNAKPEVDL